MFIELIDSLRCTAEHADSWLVVSIASRRDRFITEGTLGCPVCGRQYSIERGVARFSSSAGVPDGDEAAVLDGADDEAAMRAAAFLNVSEGGTYLLSGDWANVSHALTRIMPLRVFALNAHDAEESEQVGPVTSDTRVPLAQGSLRGAAFDISNASQAMLDSAVRCLAPRSRLIAPAATPIPADVEVIASDDRLWIAERRPPLVFLGRA